MSNNVFLIHHIVTQPCWQPDYNCFAMVVIGQDTLDGPCYQDLVTSESEESLFEVVRWCRTNLAPYRFEWPVGDEEEGPDPEVVNGADA